jgi:hypothetical protein
MVQTISVELPLIQTFLLMWCTLGEKWLFVVVNLISLKRVNGTDPLQIEALETARKEYFHLDRGENATQSDVEKDGASLSRFIDNEELRFSMRSLTVYAPWIRFVFSLAFHCLTFWQKGRCFW